MITIPQSINHIENGSIAADIIRLGGAALPVTINQGNAVIIDLAPADLANINDTFKPSYTDYFPVSGPNIDFGSHLGQPAAGKLQGDVESSQNDGAKETLMRHHIFPTTETVPNLNALYSQEKRDQFEIDLMNRLNKISENLFSIWKDTDGTFFHVTFVSGVVTKTEITTDEAI